MLNILFKKNENSHRCNWVIPDSKYSGLNEWVILDSKYSGLNEWGFLVLQHPEMSTLGLSPVEEEILPPPVRAFPACRHLGRLCECWDLLCSCPQPDPIQGWLFTPHQGYLQNSQRHSECDWHSLFTWLINVISSGYGQEDSMGKNVLCSHVQLCSKMTGNTNRRPNQTETQSNARN